MAKEDQYIEWRPLLDLIDHIHTRNIVKNLTDGSVVYPPIDSINDLAKMSSHKMAKEIVGCGKKSANVMWLALNQLGYSEPENTDLPYRINDKLIEWEGKRYKLVEDKE